jgi:hypothetical protein
VAAAKAGEINGQLTGSAAAAAKDAAIAEIRSYLGPKGIAEVQKILGLKPEDVVGFLSSRIESAVQSIPSALPVVPAVAAPVTPASEAITQDIAPPKP